jgi:hypothetical protein
MADATANVTVTPLVTTLTSHGPYGVHVQTGLVGRARPYELEDRGRHPRKRSAAPSPVRVPGILGL